MNKQKRQIENIVSTKACCGCGSCVQRCPQKCISLYEDNEGFLYPSINSGVCIDCGLCDKACPMLKGKSQHEPLAIYASINKNEHVRKKSSSGGVFSLLAEQTINDGGVVFGARFDKEWQVVLDVSDNQEGISDFRGSKYVQARTEDSFIQAEYFLNQGRKVLFSGTPCQIAGLKSFLRKEYENLVTIDCACYGVPSPKVWKRYLRELIGDCQIQNISSISFREKTTGWKNYSFAIYKDNIPFISQTRDENVYMRAFSLMLRPSCYNCKMKGLCSVSDITLADFWGVNRFSPEMDDDKGTGLVIIHTDKGKTFYPYNMTISKTHFYNEAVLHNGGLNSCPVSHPNRMQFFAELDKADNMVNLIKKMQTRSFITMIKDKIKWTLYKLYKKLGK